MKKFKFPIAFKLVLITTLLLIVATGFFAVRSSSFFEAELRQSYERSMQLQAKHRTAEVDSLLSAYMDRLRWLAVLATQTNSSRIDQKKSLDLYFSTEHDIMGIRVFTKQLKKEVLVAEVVNPAFKAVKAKTNDKEHQSPTVVWNDHLDKTSAFAGEVEIHKSYNGESVPVLSLIMPFVRDQQNNVTHVVEAQISLSKLEKIFASEDAFDIFLVDSEGQVLAHPDDDFVNTNQSLKSHPLVSSALKSGLRANHLPRFLNPTSNSYFYGVFDRSSYDLIIAAQVPESVILEPAIQVRHEAYYTGGMVLSAALTLIFIFSITLTQPIEKLLAFTDQVSRGEFDIHAGRKIRTRDEVHDLALAFDHMTTGLKALVRTQGADVADTLMKANLDVLGGTKKQVTVLFSDLRDFTQFSENTLPEDVVSMLNEYFEVMVGCIERNGGRVNKFIGDAIMAIWGAPSSSGDDIGNAIRAALEMRVELDLLNQRRIARKQIPIRIGVGIHSGEVIAGTIGSKMRLEYTVIGDTVNQASRLEASTKAFGLDLLISEEVKTQAGSAFLIELAGTAEVKGKAEALKMFRVNGLVDSQGQVQVIKTPYSEFVASGADKIKLVE